MSELRAETEANSRYIVDQGYKLVQIYECEWLRMKRTNLAVHQFLTSKYNRYMDNYWNPNQKQIMSVIQENYLFGAVKCDIRVPDHLNRSLKKCLRFSRM